MAIEACVGVEHAGLPDVPVDVLLKIFGYLDASTLCRASAVCSDWYQLTADDILWKNMIAHHVKAWRVIDHSSLPDVYTSKGDLTPKQIYLKCCPHVKKRRQVEPKLQALRSLLTSTIRSLLWKQTPFVALCGPGLESGTSEIVRKLLYEKNETFVQTGIFPGRYHGVGSGFSFKFGSRTLNLTTLYSTCKKERKSQQTPRERLRHSRMLLHRPPTGSEEGQRGPDAADVDRSKDEVNDCFELAEETRVLSASLSAVVYAVESTVAPRSRECDIAAVLAQNRAEIDALDAALPAGATLLIVACTPSASDERLPCIDVTRALGLSSLSRPWRVHNCSVENITTDIRDPINWMLDSVESVTK